MAEARVTPQARFEHEPYGTVRLTQDVEQVTLDGGGEGMKLASVKECNVGLLEASGNLLTEGNRNVSL